MAISGVKLPFGRKQGQINKKVKFLNQEIFCVVIYFVYTFYLLYLFAIG